MANEIRNWAKTLTLGNSIAKQVFLEICDCADDFGVCDRTTAQLAETLELSEPSIKRAFRFLSVKKLISRDEIEKVKGQWAKKITEVNFPDFVKEKITERRLRYLFEPGICEIPGEGRPSISQIPGEPRPGICETHGETQPSICEIPGEAENSAAADLTDPSPRISQTEGLTDPYNIYRESEDNVLNKEILNEREKDAGASFDPFAETENLADPNFRREIDRTLFWILTEKNISRRNFPVSDWLDLLIDLESENLGRGKNFTDFYQWVSGQDWVETVSPNLLKGQIEKYKKRELLEAKKVIKNGTIIRNNPKPPKRTDEDVFRESAEFYAEWEARGATPNQPG